MRFDSCSDRASVIPLPGAEGGSARRGRRKITFDDGQSEVIRLEHSPDLLISTSAKTGMGVAEVREVKQPQAANAVDEAKSAVVALKTEEKKKGRTSDHCSGSRRETS
jgi:hypothetical protein